MNKYILSCVFVFVCSFLSLSADPIRIETFRGKEIAPYTKEIVSLCNRIYREYPYLYNGSDEDYTSYLESYSDSKDSIICLAFDDKEAIGLATGMPMTKTRDVYKPPLIEHEYDLNSIFYLGEFGLKPEYHGRQIEADMYKKIEEFVKSKGIFTAISYWEVSNVPNAEQATSYIPGDDFWKKMGFKRYPDLNFTIFWTNINQSSETPHLAVYSLNSIANNN